MGVELAFGSCSWALLICSPKWCQCSCRGGTPKRTFRKDPLLKRRNAPASSATPNVLEDHEIQLKWMTTEFLPWGRKKPLQVILSTSVTLSRRKTGHCRSLPYQTGQIWFCKKIFVPVLEQDLWTDETETNVYQHDGGKKSQEELMIKSVTHHLLNMV